VASQNSRIDYIDFLKGFLLMCICLSHFGYLPLLIKYIIQPTGDIYIPTFFLISGFLYKEKIIFKSFLIRKFKSLFVPYIFFFFIFNVLDWNIYLKTIETLSRNLNSLIKAEGPQKASPIWFIIRLFEVNLLYYLITLISSKIHIRYISILLCSVIGYLMYKYSIRPPLGLDVVLSSILFFGIGHLGKNYLIEIELKLNKQVWYIHLIIIFILFSISIISKSFNQEGILAQNKINNYFLFYLAAISGGVALLSFCHFICRKFIRNEIYRPIFTYFKYISENGLIILGTHVYFIIISNQILSRVNFTSLTQGFLLKCLSIILITNYLITPLFNNRLYFILGKEKPISEPFKKTNGK
jgi:acyltransferase